MLYGNRIFCEFYFFLESFNLFGKIRKKGPITATTSSSYSSGNKNKTINLLSLPLSYYLSLSFFLSFSLFFFLSFLLFLFISLSFYLSLSLSISLSFLLSLPFFLSHSLSFFLSFPLIYSFSFSILSFPGLVKKKFL